MSSISIHPSDIIYFNLDPTAGHEISKTRPCLVIAVPSMIQNKMGPRGIVIVLPLTSSQKNFWTEIPVRKRGGMKNDSYILCHQIRALDVSRAKEKIAELNSKEMRRVRRVLKIMFEI